ncbi:MAG: hypothetical protein AAGI48_06805 [Verrucomicrobiota bacterium]
MRTKENMIMEFLMGLLRFWILIIVKTEEIPVLAPTSLRGFNQFPKPAARTQESR